MKSKQISTPEGLVIFSPVPIQFPLVCAQCGKTTDNKIAVKVSAGEPGLKPTVLLGHVGSLIEAAQDLRAGSVKIPCCPACYRPHTFGRAVTISCFICAPLLFFVIVKFASSWPEWLMVLTGFICFVMFFGAFVPYLIGRGKAMPVTVWRKAGGYFYHFYSGIFQTWADEQQIHFKEMSEQSRQS